MTDPAALKAHTDRVEAVFGRAALLAADAKTLRERAKEDNAKADAYEAQALKLRDAARSLVAKGPGCGCGGEPKRANDHADPAVLPPVETVDSTATVPA